MTPELDSSVVSKWLRNIGDTSEKPKLKDFWEKNLSYDSDATLQRYAPGGSEILQHGG